MFPINFNLLDFAKAFGLGLSVLVLWIWWLLQQVKDYQEREKEYNAALLQLSKENIATMTSLTQVIQAIPLAVTAGSNENRQSLERSIQSLKEHITAQTTLLTTVIESRHNN